MNNIHSGQNCIINAGKWTTWAGTILPKPYWKWVLSSDASLFSSEILICLLRDGFLTCVWCTWTSWGSRRSWCNKPDQTDERTTPAQSLNNCKPRKQKERRETSHIRNNQFFLVFMEVGRGSFILQLVHSYCTLCDHKFIDKTARLECVKKTLVGGSKDKKSTPWLSHVLTSKALSSVIYWLGKKIFSLSKVSVIVCTLFNIK